MPQSTLKQLLPVLRIWTITHICRVSAVSCMYSILHKLLAGQFRLSPQTNSPNQNLIKLKWGQSAAWSDFGELFCSFIYKQFLAEVFWLQLHPHFYIRIADQIVKDDEF